MGRKAAFLILACCLTGLNVPAENVASSPADSSIPAAGNTTTTAPPANTTAVTSTALPAPEVPLPPEQAPTAVVPEPAPLPADSPELHAQTALRTYLNSAEPKRLDTLTMLKFDRTQMVERMNVLAKTGAADELIDAYLYYLTALAPDPKEFEETWARLAVLLNERNSDAGVLTLLFQEGEKFPADSAAAIQLKLTQAEYLVRVGLPQAGLVQLYRLSAQPGLPANVQVVAIGRAGFLQERLQQPDQAIKAYLQTVPDLATVPQASEAVLRAAMLQLEAGKTDDALVTFEKLQAVPPDMVRQTSAGQAVTEMLALTKDPTSAREYWDHQSAWFPQWQKLTLALGLQPDDPVQLIGPSTDDYQRLAMDANAAMTAKDTTHYYQIVNLLMRSARWRPGDLPDAANLMLQGVRLTPEHLQDFLNIGLAMVNGLPSGEQVQAKELTQSLVGALIDSGHADQARDLAAMALEKYGLEGGAGQGLARLYGFAVLRAPPPNEQGKAPQGAEEAVRYLSQTLNDPEAHGRQRALAVAVLCDLYFTLNRQPEAEALLQRELAKPASESVGGASYQAALRDSLERLQQREMQLAGVDAGLNAWWGVYRLPWYGYLTSAGQNILLDSSDEPAVQAVRNFSHALDPHAPMISRASSLMDAWSNYPLLPLTGTALAQATADFAARKDLPQQLRYVAWAKTMWHLLWSGQHDAAQKLLTASPDSPQALTDRPSLDLWLNYLGQSLDPAVQQAFAEKILGQPKLNRFELVLVIRVIQTLARVGSPDAAEVVAKKLQAANLDDSAAEQFRDLRDNMEPLIAQYRATQPAYDALRKIVLESKPEAATAQLPDRWKDLNDAEQPDLDLLTQEEARTGLLAVIRDRLPYGRHPLQVFLDYGVTLPDDAADNALRYKLFETALEQTLRDDDRFYAAMFTGLVDFDNPELAQQGWAVLNSTRDPGKFPKTADFLQYYGALMNWRTGAEVDMAASFGPLEAPGLDSYKLRLALDFYLQHGDTAALQKLLQGRAADDFLQPAVLSAYLRALRVLGQDSARASTAVQYELGKDVAITWARPNRDQAEPIFELAEALNDPAAYPRAWVEYEVGQMRNPNSRDLMQMDDARLQHNWPELLEAAESFLSRNPTQYDYYWAEAKALIELGRLPEAVEPLQIFTKYSHNEEDYPEAVQWLKKIQATPATPPAAISHHH